MNLLTAVDQDVEIVIRRKPRFAQGWSDECRRCLTRRAEFDLLAA